MTRLQISEGLGNAYEGWRVGLLKIQGLLPREEASSLEAEVSGIEAGLKDRFASLNRKQLAKIEPFLSYDAHFSRWGKAYPVLLQAEGVAAKGRRIAMPDPLVRAMFAAELEGMLLTAGHDLDAIAQPLSIGLSSGSETLPTLGGSEKTPPEGDLVMRDGGGIIASVLLGPDSRTSISQATSRALFAVYAPPGVPETSILGQLARLARLAALACPGASASAPEIHAL